MQVLGTVVPKFPSGVFEIPFLDFGVGVSRGLENSLSCVLGLSVHSRSIQ